MRLLFGALLLASAGFAGAQSLLDFREDLAFRRESVEAFAERAYRQSLRQLEAEGRLDLDSRLLQRLRTVLGRLSEAAVEERSDFARGAWEVHTCRACGGSASAMAGGRLLVSEELVERLDPTDDELAFLLAHEMGHVLAEHTREFATAARYFLDNGLRREYWDIQRELNESLVAQFRMDFVSAQQELDADYIGCILAARAGFDPAAMASVLAKLDPEARSATPSSHPDAAQRLHQAGAMRQSAAIIRAAAYPLP